MGKENERTVKGFFCGNVLLMGSGVGFLLYFRIASTILHDQYMTK